eukprot:gb/GECH01008010.1/.p1 GENE.gb/GECH01008010.1/~~gb/GECH01008010.1/.p1  ORF type:complete len:198 (+),score=4.89 gb/GECH01008010.1/:1-594(+)
MEHSRYKIVRSPETKRKLERPKHLRLLDRMDQLNLDGDHQHPSHSSNRTTSEQGFTRTQEHTLEDLFNYMKQEFDEIRARFDKQDKKFDVLTEACQSQAFCYEQMRTRRHNSEFVNDLLPVPNEEGKYPKQPILAATDFAKFEYKATELNDLLKFYGYKEGVDFNANGTIFQRKTLLCHTLGVPTSALSTAKLQYTE